MREQHNRDESEVRMNKKNHQIYVLCSPNHTTHSNEAQVCKKKNQLVIKSPVHQPHFLERRRQNESLIIVNGFLSSPPLNAFRLQSYCLQQIIQTYIHAYMMMMAKIPTDRPSSFLRIYCILLQASLRNCSSTRSAVLLTSLYTRSAFQ